MIDFSKDFFQKAWGEEGYYENFSYGTGIESVCDKGLNPFFSIDKTALEIGSGGGVFTKRMVGKFQQLFAIDVIKMPLIFKEYKNFMYFELADQDFFCSPIPNESIDFCFAYNVFCHLSNSALKEYLHSVNRVLKSEADFVFMLSNYDRIKQYFASEPDQFQLGDLLPIGHFYQDHRTLKLIADLNEWEIINADLLPEHRDIVIHLKKK